jgi:transcriptional regulator with XRE-family HTH domain
VPESLGAILRTAREAKGLSVEQLAILTKINPAFVEALESGRWDLLPGRVYLKPFTKLYAEALGLNVSELYEKIDSLTPEDKKKYELPVADPAPTATGPKRVDYKIPIVAISVLAILLIISFVVKKRQSMQGSTRGDFVIPARTLFKRGEIKWERPWERPSSNPQFNQGQRLRLETTKEVWALVIADQDTLYKGALLAESGKTFVADSTFRLSLSRNDCVSAYFNGVKVAGIGTSSKKLGNFLIAPVIKEENSPDEVK